jgi:hypothetical protein
MRKLIFLCAGAVLAWIMVAEVSTSAAVAPLSNQRVMLDSASSTQQSAAGHVLVFFGRCKMGCKGTFCC